MGRTNRRAVESIQKLNIHFLVTKSMSEDKTNAKASYRTGYQLTMYYKINVLIRIAQEHEKGELPKGGQKRVAEALSVSTTTVRMLDNRLKSGEEPAQIIKSKNFETRMQTRTTGSRSS